MDNNRNVFYGMLGSIGLIFIDRILGIVMIMSSLPDIIIYFISKIGQCISILGIIFLMFFSIKLILNYFKCVKK